MSSFFFPDASNITARTTSKPSIVYKQPVKRDLVIVVDTRENRNAGLVDKIKQKLKRSGKTEDDVVLETLNIGDIQFVYKDDRKRMFGPTIERKTCADLAASIKDGRYKEQKGRLNTLHDPAYKKLYIYEGHLLERYWGIDPKSLIGAVAKPLMRGETEISMSSSMEATTDLVVEMLIYLEHMDETAEHKNMHYVDYIQPQMSKQKMVDENQLACVLRTTVNGVSAEIAKTITSKFTSLGDLIGSFVNNPIETAVAISEMSYSADGSGNERRIGLAVVRDIYKFCDVVKLKNTIGEEGVYEWAEIEGRIRRSKKRVSASSTSRAAKRLKAVEDDIEDTDDDDDRPIYTNKK